MQHSLASAPNQGRIDIRPILAGASDDENAEGIALPLMPSSLGHLDQPGGPLAWSPRDPGGTSAMSASRQERQPRRAFSMTATSIFLICIIASNARFASPPPRASASVSTRGVICQDIPHLSLHQPHALS